MPQFVGQGIGTIIENHDGNAPTILLLWNCLSNGDWPEVVKTVEAYHRHTRSYRCGLPHMDGNGARAIIDQFKVVGPCFLAILPSHKLCL